MNPVMAGANVPSLNALLDNYYISLGDQRVLSGDFVLDKRQVTVDSATEIVRFPKGGHLLSTELIEEPLSVKARKSKKSIARLEAVDGSSDGNTLTPTIGILPKLPGLINSGSLIIMTDSDCVDTSSITKNPKCYWLL